EDTLGATVGQLSAIDPEGGTVTFEVQDARFEIVGNTTLKLRSDQLIDWESLTSGTINVTIKATDGTNLSSSQIFQINVLNGAEGTAVDGYVSGATVFRDA